MGQIEVAIVTGVIMPVEPGYYIMMLFKDPENVMVV